MALVLVGAVLCFLGPWLILHLAVRRRLRVLQVRLPEAYERAAFASAGDEKATHLIPLAIDLMRKRRCTPTFKALSRAEQRVALHAYAIETQPDWISRYAIRHLNGSERAIATQLRHIKASRPHHPEVHFGAIKKAQLRLRSAPET
ncbi:hypothetical protein [Yoonia sp. SS1-5]|uniref:Uncharacterized protein n=1 Tax=Yoonia rhodophyticola TaxID=3137370 RepID=A0AAN0NLI4_9RHOB